MDHAHRVLARASLNLQHHGRFAVQPRQCPDFLGAILNLAEIAQPNGGTIDRGHHQVREVASVFHSALGAQSALPQALINQPAWYFRVLPHQGFTHLEDRQSMGRQAIGVDRHLHRTIRGTGDLHLSHAGCRFNDVLDKPIGQQIEIARRARSRDRQRQNRGRVGILLLDHGRVDAGR